MSRAGSSSDGSFDEEESIPSIFKIVGDEPPAVF